MMSPSETLSSVPGAVKEFANHKDYLRRNQFGYTFGGPIRKSRVFFFSDLESTRLRQGTVFNDIVPSDAMRRGDFLLTPGWHFHGHQNVTDHPMAWIDGLDIPFVHHTGSGFFEGMLSFDGAGQLFDTVNLQVANHVSQFFAIDNVTTSGPAAAVPEPGALAIGLAALVPLAWRLRRRR